MRIKTNLESRVNALRMDGKTYGQIAEEIGITKEEVRRLVFKRPNAGAKKKAAESTFPDITPSFLAEYKRRIKIGQKVTVKNHLFEVERGGNGAIRKKVWIKAKVVAKYPHIVQLNTGHAVTYQELISYDRYGKTQEEE